MLPRIFSKLEKSMKVKKPHTYFHLFHYINLVHYMQVHRLTIYPISRVIITKTISNKNHARRYLYIFFKGYLIIISFRYAIVSYYDS